MNPWCSQIDPIHRLDQALRFFKDIVMLNNQDWNAEEELESYFGVLCFKAVLPKEQWESSVAEDCGLGNLLQSKSHFFLPRVLHGVYSSIKIVGIQSLHCFHRKTPLGKDHHPITTKPVRFAVILNAPFGNLKHGVDQIRIGRRKLSSGVIIPMKAQRKPFGVLPKQSSYFGGGAPKVMWNEGNCGVEVMLLH